jgi:hypothetical protein
LDVRKWTSSPRPSPPQAEERGEGGLRGVQTLAVLPGPAAPDAHKFTSAAAVPSPPPVEERVRERRPLQIPNPIMQIADCTIRFMVPMHDL